MATDFTKRNLCGNGLSIFIGRLRVRNSIGIAQKGFVNQAGELFHLHNGFFL